ncbi:hypothetical protein GN316_18655 [Xylophilus sp. Kf1]|nr:hypothetical protein [Xylophilus sp. Kf1]
MTPATMDPRAGPWGTADAVFDRLEGRWALDREIAGTARMAGSAVFRRLPDGWLGYREEARVMLADGRSHAGSQQYIFERAAGGFRVHFAETPPRLFHAVAVAAQAGALVGSTTHLCVADTYDSRYTFRADGGFEVVHTVRGPRKDYVSRTVFTRAD